MAETATELRAQLAKIGKDEAVLQSKLQLLAEERHAILRKLGAVVYPVLTLPSDVTAEIFMHYLGNFPDISYDYNIKTHPPLLLASVCKAWRRLALSFPRLWASLGMYWPPESVIRREQLLQCWLPRAGGCPIDLGLSGSDLTPSMCDTVAQYGSRLRNLSISEKSATQFSLATQRNELCFAALKTLTVDVDGTFDEDGVTITAFSDAPQLREVYIPRGSLSFIKLPWNQLTTLDLEETLSLKVLKQTPNLEVLSFSTSDSDDEDSDDAWTIVPIVLTKLHTLKIGPFSTFADCNVLHGITLPALRTLEVGQHLDIEPLRSLISRSSCALQTMHLYDRSAQETIECLRLSETLEHLTLEFVSRWADFAGEDESGMENEYSDLFHFLEDGQLPALKTLSFHDFPVHIDAALLTSMLNSRRESRGVARLESFRLAFHHAERCYEEDHVSNLRSLLTDGSSIHIEWATQGPPWNTDVSPGLAARINAVS
ncbi:hypothetical protein C8J57DRAFT_1719165 [Mycena rebaudengoi]|nr:hypothetical protein C8J57DRAFT_1719165 [Mycena rebaudengoi]